MSYTDSTRYQNGGISTAKEA